MTTEERFWSNVSKSDGCWLWTAGTSDTGYGEMTDSVTKKKIATHRYSWMIHFGEIPKGIRVCHHCDVRRCVRPDHLFLGTQKDNILDALEKGRLAPQRETFLRLWREKWAGLRCGTNIHCSKLKADDVREIKRLYNLGGNSYESLGKQFGISFGSVRDIIKGTSWKHIQ